MGDAARCDTQVIFVVEHLQLQLQRRIPAARSVCTSLLAKQAPVVAGIPAHHFKRPTYASTGAAAISFGLVPGKPCGTSMPLLR